MKEKIKEMVLAEIKRVSFPIIASKEYSVAWWDTSFGIFIREKQSETLYDLLQRVESIFETEGI